MTSNNDFYKHKAWKGLEDDIKEIKDGQIALTKRVNRIDRKLTRIIGMATGVGAMAGLIVTFAKDAFMFFRK